jgi:molecular chaperone GrpE
VSDEQDSAPEEAAAAAAVGLDLVPESPEAALAELRRERDELREALLRKRADFDNFRKRVERDRQSAAVEIEAGLLRELVPSLDNLDAALAGVAVDPVLRQGVELTRRELLSVLEARGLVVDEPVGLPFDPHRHQAVSHEAAPGFADGTVVAVFRKGYTYRDRLLRPAMVKVAKGEEAPSDDGSDAVH